MGSPRKDGRTNKLVTRTIEGSKEAGADTEITYLIDYDILQWSESHRTAPEELIEIVDKADAYVLGAPVYILDINGLTKDFIDTIAFSMPNSNGKPALGIAIAGGGGLGAISALKSIYWFFVGTRLRGINPLPVSRFNYDKALKEAYESGKHLVELERKPFEFDARDFHKLEKNQKERCLVEGMSYFFSLRFMNYDMLDETLLVTEQLMEISEEKGMSIEKAKTEYEKANELIRQGRKNEAIEHAAKAFTTLHYEPSAR